ncbi:MAG: 4'-phosphopantetheinyl transferase superfamily protein [Lentisphaerae bacterium]|nr:4'-phosphopantetheinyl transferase superfamily protein [Lentisphaerota bacterium]
MPDIKATKKRVFPSHPAVSSALWHFTGAKVEDIPREEWFTDGDLDEIKTATSSKRIEEWLSVRIALKSLMLDDGVAESALHIHVRKSSKGCPHVVVYNPDTGKYARYHCSLAHKGPLVFAAYSRMQDVRVGVDIERRSWRLPYLRRRFLSDKDTLIETGDHIGEYTVLWAFKEAVSKILGLGMAYGLANISCQETNLGTCMLTDAEDVQYIGNYVWFGKYALTVVADPISPETDSDVKRPKPSGRSWHEKISRGRRLRALRKQRSIASSIKTLKEKDADLNSGATFLQAEANGTSTTEKMKQKTKSK